MDLVANNHLRRIRQIRRLYKSDDEFQLIWEDYLLARKARRHFGSLGEVGCERAEEYRILCDELAEEVRRYLDS